MKKLLEIPSTTNTPTTIRIIPTTEGLAFCAISAGGGAIVVRPGDVLIIEIEDIIQALQNYSTANQASGTSFVSSHLIRASKTTAEPDDV